MKLLLVDTSFSARPIHDHLVAMGHDVHVVGGNPQDALASADGYIRFDYSDADGLVELIDHHRIEAIVPGGNDLSYRVCSLINQRRRLCLIDPPATERVINDKAKFRAFAVSCGLHVPCVLDPAAAASGLPVIVKPADAFSGHGVTVVRDGGARALDQALAAARKASPTGSVVVEQFVEGQLFSHSAFLVDGRVDVDFIVEEHGTIDPHAVDTSRVVDDFNPGLLAKVRADIEMLAAGLQLVDGLVHTQFICDGEDFWLIEVTRRCPGDLYSMLIEHSTGYPYAARYARSFLGMASEVPAHHARRRQVIRHTLTPPRDLVFRALAFHQPLQLIEHVPLAVSGARLRKGPPGRAGLIFIDCGGFGTDATLHALLERRLYDWK